MLKVFGWLVLGAGIVLVLPILSFLAAASAVGFISWVIYGMSTAKDDE